MRYSQILSLIALSTQSVNGYGQNLCRQFHPHQLVENFNFDDFSGQWFPIYESKNSMYITGKCPIISFERLVGKHAAQQKRIQSFSSNRDYMDIRTSYKGMSMIVDNLRDYRGYFIKGTSSGSFYTGSVLRPLKKFDDNFQVVSTDYETYAIIYTCTAQTAMYDKEVITVLARMSPAFGNLPVDFEDTVRHEFERIFGNVPLKKEPQNEEDRFLYPEEEPEILQPEDVEPKLSQPEDVQISEDSIADIKDQAIEDIESVSGVQVEKFPRRIKTYGKPLEFDQHLQLSDHEGCDTSSYPDLNLTLVERNKQREQQRRIERQVRSPGEEEHSHIYPDQEGQN